MAFGRQQRDFCALALQQRVGRNRRAVHEAVGLCQHLRARHVQPPRQLFQPGHDAERLIRRRRRRFREYRAAALVRRDEVRIGAADVNADRVHGQALCPADRSAVRPCSRSRSRASADALFRRSPAATAGGANFETIAGMQLDADFLGAQRARRAAFGHQTVAMRHAVLAAKHAAGTVAHALAGGIAARGLCRLQHHVEGDAEAAAKLAVAAGAGAEFVMTKVAAESAPRPPRCCRTSGRRRCAIRRSTNNRRHPTMRHRRAAPETCAR